eukprot:TRINITY_DN7206_c1_g1_i1.p1 TRINITY_DN7206_c1_g1~~TRINITY_DN7206_c1_g1_i1.p1  ORF type:complete len:265 (-),score=79.32 TRINITY_DN7206_c1_g1_i1:49-843(-)
MKTAIKTNDYEVEFIILSRDCQEAINPGDNINQIIIMPNGESVDITLPEAKNINIIVDDQYKKKINNSLRFAMKNIYISRKEVKKNYGSRAKPKFENAWKKAKDNVCFFHMKVERMGDKFKKMKNERTGDISLMNLEVLWRKDIKISKTVSRIIIKDIHYVDSLEEYFEPCNKCKKMNVSKVDPCLFVNNKNNNNILKTISKDSPILTDKNSKIVCGSPSVQSKMSLSFINNNFMSYMDNNFNNSNNTNNNNNNTENNRKRKFN